MKSYAMDQWVGPITTHGEWKKAKDSMTGEEYEWRWQLKTWLGKLNKLGDKFEEWTWEKKKEQFIFNLPRSSGDQRSGRRVLRERSRSRSRTPMPGPEAVPWPVTGLSPLGSSLSNWPCPMVSPVAEVSSASPATPPVPVDDDLTDDEESVEVQGVRRQFQSMLEQGFLADDSSGYTSSGSNMS